MSFVQIDPSQTELLQKDILELTQVLKEVPMESNWSEPLFLKALKHRYRPEKETKLEEVSTSEDSLDDFDRQLERIDIMIGEIQLDRMLENQSGHTYRGPITLPQSDSHAQDLDEVLELSEEIQSELIQGKVNQDQLAKLNKKLESLKINYGNVAGVAVAAAAVISGLTDLLELIKSLSGQ
ncbi:hypothetical protein [Hazenella coriacea]|uniref:Uncharacterized protein n=1 Tax=Hazenella coriacea TaxID=1179467 RepID=A0A4R3L9V8_9BACL|nr:hypothetical protein [Hazenella coriacea]TCS96603.1 hypothetical protein EDD58_101239 [Hazenella coriacea]